MATKKLHYFDVNGLGEAIRYILHYAGEKFEDIRYDRKSWPIKNVKDSLPFGLLPLYEEGNRSLHQSLAIARYVARKANLVPTDPWEEAVLDAVVYSVYDIWGHLIPYIKETDPVKKQEIKKKMMDETIDYFFSRFEKELKKNGGYFGGKLTWADFILVTFVEAVNLFFDTEIERNYPAVKALVQKIQSLPRVKDYIATRKPYTV
ncbi:glutathione S-transferase-like [Pectinophora gossypiella]|uniref:glutathione S-transferase-like n=1 Tax=Pectinophora gossypiella TaxID=13191 RepID=UPI00214E0762|nr:glutathione S-transferase-like [Pectinophora gossypiella]